MMDEMLKRVKSAALKPLFFIGWLLSPFTFWNDAFVNIPIAVLTANILKRVMPVDILTLTLVSYWLTNIVGIVLMAVSGKEILAAKGGFLAAFIRLIITVIIYSGVLVIIYRIKAMWSFF